MEREPMSSDDRPEAAAAAAAAAAEPVQEQPQPQPLEWRFAQVFGERAAGEDVQEGNEARRGPPVPGSGSVSPPRDLLGPVGLRGGGRVGAAGSMGRAGDCEPWGGFCGDLGVEALALLRCRKCYARGVLTVIQYHLTGRA